MSERFKNSRSRVERAAFHIEILKSEWRSIIEKSGLTAVARKDKNSGWYIASAVLPTATVERIAKNTLALEVGEFAYQLRSALDGLIWETIAIRQRAEPSTNASGLNRLDFPILNGGKRDFQECGLHKFPFPQQLKDWLESIQPDSAEKPVGDPDRGLKTTLEDLHNLARMDRHRRLRIVAVIPDEISFRGITYPFPSELANLERIESCDLFSGQYDFARFKIKSKYGASPYELCLETKLTFHVQIEGLEAGEDIGTQLLRFMHAVNRVIAKFESVDV